MELTSFFVLSGYLITRIILAELENTTCSFRSFYERRARRILPALFLVMISFFPLAYSYLPPTDFINFCHRMLAALLFSSNFYFYLAITNYGAESSLLMPFLHTWSLAVEEKFYIVFPFILLLAHRISSTTLQATLVILASTVSVSFPSKVEPPCWSSVGSFTWLGNDIRTKTVCRSCVRSKCSWQEG